MTVALLFLVASGLALAALTLVLSQRDRMSQLERDILGLKSDIALLRQRTGPAAAGAPVPRRAEPETRAVPADPAAATAVFRVTPPVPHPAAAPASPAPGSTPRRDGPGAGAPPVFTAPASTAGRGLERQLAGQLPVWIGSIALFLAGAYLVKFTFDRGLLGPAARVTIGIVFGATLLAGGEILRRSSARVAQGLAAAGIADLYASLLAGITLYGLIPRTLGFGLLAATTAVAVLLSTRQGPLIAALGLVGGFVSPALIGSTEPNAAALFAYLFLLEVGLLTAARPRAWWPLAAATLLGAGGWSWAWMTLLGRPGDGPVVGLFLLGTLAAFVVAFHFRIADDAWGDRETRWRVVSVAGAAAAVLLALVVSKSEFGTLEWIYFGLLTAGALALGRLDESYRALPWLAGACSLALFVAWPATIAARPLPGSVFWSGVFMGALVGAGAYAASWGSRHPASWTALASASSALHFLVLWSVFRREPPVAGWGATSLALGAVFIVMTVPAARRLRSGLAPGPDAVAALAAGAAFFVGAAVPFELDRFALTIGWALEVAALAFIGERLGVRTMRVLAAVLGGAVLARLLFNPFLLRYPTGTWPVVNWILFGYGIPLAAFACAALVYRRAGAHRAATVAELSSVALALALLALEVRHYFHVASAEDAARATLGQAGFELAEWGAIFALWTLLGWALLRASAALSAGSAAADFAPDVAPGTAPRTPALPVTTPAGSLALGGQIATLLGVGGALGVLVLGSNPLFIPLRVGTVPILNAVLFAYGSAGLLALLAAREYRRRGEPVPALAGGLASLVLFFALVTLEVRQAYHGAVLAGGSIGSAELYTYSAAFVLFGTVLLVLGIVTRGLVLRWSSLVVMMLAAAKVFLFDLSELKDLYRVFSLLGLGASLLLLAFLYQRFVFRPVEP